VIARITFRIVVNVLPVPLHAAAAAMLLLPESSSSPLVPYDSFKLSFPIKTLTSTVSRIDTNVRLDAVGSTEGLEPGKPNHREVSDKALALRNSPFLGQFLLNGRPQLLAFHGVAKVILSSSDRFLDFQRPSCSALATDLAQRSKWCLLIPLC
jgi:hypothetical protein